jgi:hypothetical protein
MLGMSNVVPMSEGILTQIHSELAEIEIVRMFLGID